MAGPLDLADYDPVGAAPLPKFLDPPLIGLRNELSIND